MTQSPDYFTEYREPDDQQGSDEEWDWLPLDKCADCTHHSDREHYKDCYSCPNQK